MPPANGALPNPRWAGELAPVHHAVQGTAAQAGHLFYGSAAKDLVVHVVCSRVVVASTHGLQTPGLTVVNDPLPSKLHHLAGPLASYELRPALHQHSPLIKVVSAVVSPLHHCPNNMLQDGLRDLVWSVCRFC